MSLQLYKSEINKKTEINFFQNWKNKKKMKQKVAEELSICEMNLIA